MTAWYCLRVWTRRELDVAMALTDAGLFAYVPQETVLIPRGTVERPHTRPAAPGYVFVHCEPSDFAKIRAVDGVFSFVLTTLPDGSRTPARMPALALLGLFLAEAFGQLDQTRFRPAAYKPRRNDRVRVVGGMWKGWIGRIISVGKRKTSIAPENGPGRLQVDNDVMEAA